jgi:hypothetical protein
MSLISLYSEKQEAFALPKGYVAKNYIAEVAKMNSKGTLGNDLVQRDLIDPTFRPPTAQNSYLETVFQKGKNKNQK